MGKVVIDIAPLPGAFGVAIGGLSASSPPDAETRRMLNDLWIEHGLLLFPGIGTSEAALVEVSSWFGELEIHPLAQNLLAETPEVLDISYRPPRDAGDVSQPVYRVNGELRCGWLPWHSDLIYRTTINRGGILRAIDVPGRLGETGFIDRIAAHEALPAKLAARIEGLFATYRLSTRMERQRFVADDVAPVAPGRGAEDMERQIAAGQFPEVAHPMVFEQPESGRRILNVSPTFATGIEEMDAEEGDALLRAVIAHLTDPRFVHFHHYAANDLLLFDNWRVAHMAVGVEPQAVRAMQRTTIKGDYALGRLAAA
jgi:taurine dioxygenase